MWHNEKIAKLIYQAFIYIYIYIYLYIYKEVGAFRSCSILNTNDLLMSSN